MTMPKQLVLITGGSGMVGKNLSENLVDRSWTIKAPTRNELDLMNYSAVVEYLDQYKPDIIIHCAGKVGGIQANINNPVSFFLENLQIGCNVVHAARNIGIPNLINLGSSCMYPKGHDDSLTEDLLLTGQLEPTNEGYALAKLSVAKLCEYISIEDSSFSYKTLLPCNLYGKYDNFDELSSHLIPSIIRKVHYAKIYGQKTVDIWGDGTARREFMYAGDLAMAIIYIIENFDRTPELINIGLGYDYSIDEYYQAVASVIDYSGSFSHDLTKPVGMKRKLLDTTLQARLGWKPNTSLEEGIQKTYEFYIQNFF